MECWKNGYTTEKEARTTANHRHKGKSKRRRAPKLYVYQCWNCKLWHLTKRHPNKKPGQL